MRLETLAVHAGADIDPTTGAIAPPVHLSTTFEHGPACEETHGYTYIREKNPTQTAWKMPWRSWKAAKRP